MEIESLVPIKRLRNAVVGSDTVGELFFFTVLQTEVIHLFFCLFYS